jgi:hypothetical protein
MDVNNPIIMPLLPKNLNRADLKVSLYTAKHPQRKADEVVEKFYPLASLRKSRFKILAATGPIGRDKTDDELKTQASALQNLEKA